MVDTIQPKNNAARQRAFDLLRHFITTETDLNCRYEKRYKPLIITCYNNCLVAAGFLLIACADVNAVDLDGDTV